jgi:uncharacterized protein (DUF885 family)
MEPRSLERRVVDIVCRYDGQAAYEDRPFVPTAEALNALEGEIAALREQVAGPPTGASDPIGQVLREHHRETLASLTGRLALERASPHRYVRGLLRSITARMSLDERDAATRLQLLMQVLEHAPRVLEAAARLGLEATRAQREYLADALRSFAASTLQLAPSLAARFVGAESAALDRLSEQLRSAAQSARLHHERLAAAPQAPADRPEAGPAYDVLLDEVYGIDIRELLAWHREEVDRRRRDLDRLARTIDPSRSAQRILEEDLAPYEDPAEILPRMREFVALARAQASRYVTLPEGEACEVWPVPEYLRDAYPWGGYFSGGDLLRGGLRGAVFLNVQNHRTLTRGWIKLNAIHECYPGHHAHFVKTAAGNMPGSFKIAPMMSPSSAFCEALCMRSETLLRDIFDDGRFPLFVLYRRLHTAVRVWVDLLLHHERASPERAADVYREQMGFGESVARGQVYAQLLTPGYFTVYHYGSLRLEEIERRSHASVSDFSERLFSSGKVSLRTFERLEALSATERNAILHGFDRTSSAPAPHPPQ